MIKILIFNLLFLCLDGDIPRDVPLTEYILIYRNIHVFGVLGYPLMLMTLIIER